MAGAETVVDFVLPANAAAPAPSAPLGARGAQWAAFVEGLHVMGVSGPADAFQAQACAWPLWWLLVSA